ncbi:transcription factor RAX2-like [Panicum miliaceum]|uniref:Transcription factor RAX2-like n=1 Tax=Panicum miliaceum TaxID=4540 RepID=A0A3L6S6J6_PANMI|nr:transcription factor RAX2-like [Panicum miliaceum]
MMKKGKWSKEEDSLIKNHIEKYGIDRSWQALSNTLVQPPVPVVAAQSIAAAPVSGPVKIEQKQAVVSLPRLGKTPPPPPPPPRACDQTGERVMDIVCAPMSPAPLSFMEPDKLACIYQFDDIDSFLPWFDHH